ncbi:MULTISPECIES: SDR family oxidoreductase [unclassified Streptomyces]|uniref:SDR family oxidoreductase n=1 Tax=unclassified Streptomyces TaxID=2593676 RepID=UPI000CD5636F|nr:MULTISPECIES: SDR family oxidoreductase [unclassified Streptomyces]
MQIHPRRAVVGGSVAETRLRGRVAVVTGAARGVGKALARRLSGAGMTVALLGREKETLFQAAAELSSESICIEVDVTDRAALGRAAQRVGEQFGPASVVVANAGIAAGGPFSSCDPDLWRRVIEVNLVGAANTARAFLPQLARSRGYFLQIASTAAFGSAPMMSAYCASKSGAESFALALRGEVEPDGVTVGIAYLHWTGTDMVADLDLHPVLRALRANQPGPARRVHSPERVADWLTAGITRRSHQIYAPPWLRYCQPLRPLFPAVVGHIARREMRKLPLEELRSATGVMGDGGRADWNPTDGRTGAPLDGDRTTPPR